MSAARRARKPAPAAAASPGASAASSAGSGPAVWWRAGVVALAGVLAYSNALTGPFIFDDQVSISRTSRFASGGASAQSCLERELPTAYGRS
jgi:hypothetical protein